MLCMYNAHHFLLGCGGQNLPLLHVSLVAGLLFLFWSMLLDVLGGVPCIDRKHSHLIRIVSIFLIGNPFAFPWNFRTLYSEDDNAHKSFVHDIRTYSVSKLMTHLIWLWMVQKSFENNYYSNAICQFNVRPQIWNGITLFSCAVQFNIFIGEMREEVYQYVFSIHIISNGKIPGTYFGIRDFWRG